MNRKRVAGVYAKPLLGDIHVDPTRVLRTLKSNLHQRLKHTLMMTAFSDAAKKRLAKSIQIHIKPNSVLITTNFPGFFPLLKGQRKQQMSWLTKARAPIPIVLDSGKIIFRNATPQSMKNGSWWHPGRKPTDFVGKAKKEARAYVKKRLAKEIMKQLKASLSR